MYKVVNIIDNSIYGEYETYLEALKIIEELYDSYISTTSIKISKIFVISPY